MFALMWWRALQPAEQAAWVQAIGSVLAIFVAVAIPAINSWSKSNAERWMRKERELNATLRIYDSLSSLRVSIDEYYETTAPNYDDSNQIVSNDPHEGNFQSLIPPLIAAMASLNEMGSLAPVFRKFIFKLIELDRYLKMIPSIQRSGSGAFWRNNLDDIRIMVAEVRDEADLVLEKINVIMTEAKLR